MAGGLRAVGPKADIALIVADEDAIVGGAFTQNVMCAAPVIYCKEVLAKKSTCRAVSLLSCCTSSLSAPLLYYAQLLSAKQEGISQDRF